MGESPPDLALWLIRLEHGLRTGRLDVAGEAVARLRDLGIDVRVHLWPGGGRVGGQAAVCGPKLFEGVAGE